MRRPLAFLLLVVIAFALLAGTSLTGSPASAATIAATTTCSNGVDDTGGFGLICEVTVVNTITTSGGSATVTSRTSATTSSSTGCGGWPANRDS